MSTKYILAFLAALFVVASVVRRSAAPGQTRTWLLVAAVFACVSGYLFYQG